MIIILPILAVLFTSSILTYKFISYEKKEFLKKNNQLEKEYINELKQRIKNRINRVENLIQTNIKIITEYEKATIKNFIEIGYKTIEDTYLHNKNLSKEKIIEKIKQRLKNIRFYDNGSGYYFLFNLDKKTIMNTQKSTYKDSIQLYNNETAYYFLLNLNNKVIMNPQNPNNEGENFSNLTDVKGKYFIQKFREIILSKGEGFTTWHWTKPKKEGVFEKIGYIKLFKPLDIYIGTAKYQEDINKRIEQEIIKIINTFKYAKDEYIFALNDKGTTLSHINKTFIGKPISQISKLEQEIIINILKAAKNKNGGFIEYIPRSHNLENNLSKKISYVKKIESLNWIIGTGQYTIKLKNQITLRKKELKNELKKTTKTIIIISILISLILIFILTYLAKHLQQRFAEYEEKITKKNKELNTLNDNLEKEVKKQVFDILKKDEMLNHQSKLAAMGEMIGNIAHQWRQPLSTISTAASGIKMQDEMGILEKNIMYYSLDTIVHNTKILSQTIEDFRNFFKKDKEKVHFNIENTLKRVFTLISSSLKNKNIHIIKNIDACIIYGLENELTQALLNIFTNAKDALQESKYENKFIFIDIHYDKKQIYIKIKDNAGGIKENILDKIFEPYFTTKFKSQGTGIGLYMTRTIIVNHMKGQINAKNVKFEYLDKKYIGAEFEIILDKK